MVERAVWDREAAGSKPVTRTKNPLKSQISEDFYYFFVYCGAESVVLFFSVCFNRSLTSACISNPDIGSKLY